MGRGDKRSKRGKIWRGSYGNTRPKSKATTKSTKKEA
ncbi:MAG: 30S ribosomal protein THX [Saprospiraceae bacterium]|nr:30S ribosomal protein THX [Saprospiraceae bacterium]